MTVILLPSPELQFADANGRPYAAGTLETYVPGGSTPKATWNDPAGGGGHLNTNPLILDSAGRCTLYGDGAYRLVLRDALGNLVWDAVTSSVVSAAMLPVVQAATIADAVVALGIQALIDASVAAEATLRAAADTTLQTNIDTQATNLANAETTINAAIAAETAARIAGDATLQGEIDTINTALGLLPTNAAGSVRVGEFSTVSPAFDITFSPAFPTACVDLKVYPIDPVIDPSVFISFTLVSASRVTGNLQDNFAVPVSGPVKYVACGY